MEAPTSSPRASYMAEQQVVQARRDTCDACPYKRTHYLVPSTCGLCGCVIVTKTLFSNQTCPDKRWQK